MANDRRRWLAIALHDVSPITEEPCRRLADLVQQCVPQAPLTLLIVPQQRGIHSIDSAKHWRRWVDRRIAGGDEPALHGLTHVDEGPRPRTLSAWFARRLMTDSEAEFSTLDAATARWRIECGLGLFARCGWRAAGFVPPAWQICAPARAVLKEFDFAYTSTRTHLYRLPDWHEWRCSSLVFSARSALRRRFSISLAAALSHSQRDAALLRVALHPADATNEDSLAAWRRFLTQAGRDRTPVTKGQAIELLGQPRTRTVADHDAEPLRHNRPATP